MIASLYAYLGSLSQELRLFQFDQPQTGHVQAKTYLTGQCDWCLPVSCSPAFDTCGKCYWPFCTTEVCNVWMINARHPIINGNTCSLQFTFWERSTITLAKYHDHNILWFLVTGNSQYFVQPYPRTISLGSRHDKQNFQSEIQTFQPQSHANLEVLKKSPEKPGDWDLKPGDFQNMRQIKKNYLFECFLPF